MHPMTPASIARFTIASLLCAGLLGTAGCSSSGEVQAFAPAPVTTTTTRSLAPVATAATVGAYPPSEFGPLVAGPYQASKADDGTYSIEADLPESGVYAIDEPGFLALADDPYGSVSYVSIIDTASTRVVETPLDARQFENPSYVLDRSLPMSDDVLAWLAAQTGVSAGPIETTVIGGVEARRMTVTFGPIDGGLDCMAFDPRPCHFLFYGPDSRVSFFQFVGDTVTVYEVPLVTTRLIVVVDLSIDPERASALADSLRFSVEPEGDMLCGNLCDVTPDLAGFGVQRPRFSPPIIP